MLIFKDIRCPPSLNNLYPTHGTKRVRSSEYRAWISAAGWEIKLQWQRQGGQPIEGAYRIAVVAHLLQRRDPDNLWKALLDLLVELGITKGDAAAYNRHHEMTVKPTYREWPEERVHIELAPWEENTSADRLPVGGPSEAGRISALERGAGSAKADGVAVAHHEMDDAPPSRRDIRSHNARLLVRRGASRGPLRLLR